MQTQKKIWIDLDNSPHVPFFLPIIQELNKRGHSVMLTTRDAFQVCELADYYNLDYDRIGRHYGNKKIFKIMGLIIRAMQLAPSIIKKKPDLALSHCSRSQLLLSTILGIPSVMMDDYEYSTYLPFIQPKLVLVPEVISSKAMEKHFKVVRKYPGIKEDVYVPTFKPDFHIRKNLGIGEDEILVTVRPPATEAHYHNRHSERLFSAAINRIGSFSDSRMVILPRTEAQEKLVKTMWSQWFGNKKIIVPCNVVNGLNLIWHSDLVISGGGTMNREAAALRVPVYSIFTGKIGSVDKYLAESGLLVFLRSIEDINTKIAVTARKKTINTEQNVNVALYRIIDEIEAIM